MPSASLHKNRDTSALDVRARQVTTEERFDFNVEKSLSLRLRQVV